MKFLVAENAQMHARLAAERLVANLAGCTGLVSICLAGGSTPRAMYRLLAAAPFRQQLPWERVHLFLSDERFVPPDDERSNIRMVHEALADHVPLPAGNLHAIRTGLGEPELAAADYENEIRNFLALRRAESLSATLFDVAVLGIGTDGHTASLFPGQASLQENERLVVAVPKANVPPFVSRISLTVPALSNAACVLFLATGVEKRPVISQIRAGRQFPATEVSSRTSAEWIVDRASV